MRLLITDDCIILIYQRDLKRNQQKEKKRNHISHFTAQTTKPCPTAVAQFHRTCDTCDLLPA